MNSEPLKLCINCKRMVKATSDGTPLCNRKGKPNTDLVNGNNLWPMCTDEREYQDWIDNILFGKICGPEAKYFEPKEAK